MKSIYVAVLTLSLAAPGVSFAENWKTVRKEADFRSMVVDRKIVWDGNWGIINSNGTANGRLQQGGKYVGNWVWSGRFYCRNFVFKGKETGTNCAKVEVSGNKVRFLNDKGKGRVTVAEFTN